MEQASDAQDAGVFAEYASVGQYTSVEILNGNRDRFKSALLGFKPPLFLILELPGLLQYGNLRDELLPGQGLIVRTICEKTTGACMGFHARVEAVLKSPCPVFFVSYPNHIETRELRQEKRQPANISAHMFKHEDEGVIAGTIVDISPHGCCFEMPVGELDSAPQAEVLQLRYLDPLTERCVTRTARVCSQRREGQRLALGFALEGEAQ
ncbi:MAG TPA: PilZ domain-containing protein [Hyphomicrobiales bacterium]|nr:PilZ domain-containing protein [Hyphomicrobiales bacterium]